MAPLAVWIILIGVFKFPTVNIIVVLRSSWMLFAVVLIIKLPLPALPLSGETVHKSLFSDKTLQSLLAVKDIVLDSLSEENEIPFFIYSRHSSEKIITTSSFSSSGESLLLQLLNKNIVLII